MNQQAVVVHCNVISTLGNGSTDESRRGAASDVNSGLLEIASCVCQCLLNFALMLNLIGLKGVFRSILALSGEAERKPPCVILLIS